MEAEETRDYKEPCVQCSDVNWGLTEEGKFYCRSCHNVIERTREVVTGDVVANARAQSISKGLKNKKKLDKGWEWYICEGFQYILWKQAEALQALGVSSKLKDEVVYNIWKRYLQKSEQAYFNRTVNDTRDVQETCDSDTDGDRDLDITRLLELSSFASDTDPVSDSSIGGISSFSRASGKSTWSGSVDGGSYLLRKKKDELIMSMPMTLAFCYLSLLWLRESITLSDLLRLVMDGHVPYLNAYKDFPEEVKVYGDDLKIFHVESWPSYADVLGKAHALATHVELPRFPDIAEGSFLHPNILCMKYLMETNLPDEMHSWTCRVVKKIGIGETDFLTLHPGKKSSQKVKYDILAIAVIVVVLKLFFLLDDKYEWLVANYVEERNKSNKGCPLFDIKKWYMVVKSALDVEQKKLNEERIRHLWRCEKPLLYNAKDKSVVLKRRQMVVDLQRQFRTLSGLVEPTEKPKPSSFQFCWSDETTKSSCFHEHSLDGVLLEKRNVLTTLNGKYWLCTTKLCCEKECGCLAHYEESKFPCSYQFVLNLFSFLLRVQPSVIHEEVCAVEHKLFYSKLHKKSKIRKRKKRPETALSKENPGVSTVAE